MKIGDKVKIIKATSNWFGIIGEIITQGNGTNWQVDVGWGIGIYYSEKDLKIIE